MKFPTAQSALLARSLLPLALLLAAAVTPARAGSIGADTPWITHEAEAMTTNGTVLGPKYGPHLIEMESSGLRCVRLEGAEGFVEFTATADANALVLRYSLPDSPEGTGTKGTLSLLVNGTPVRSLALDSHQSWVYGTYPFTNRPSDGKARNFYDELRVMNLRITKGDVVRLQRVSAAEPACTLDLVDLEQAPLPLAAPADALSLADFGANGKGETDDTDALRRCLAEAVRLDRTVWVPAGCYRLTGDILLQSKARIQGAGMWHTTFVGDPALYNQADRRVRFRLVGKDIRLADFAILGQLDHRIDEEANDGIMGAGCSDSTISRIWIEHTKVGIWIYNGSRLRVEGCRFRNLLADGINLCVGTNNTVVENCAARGTGDDCFAIWPAAFDQGFIGEERQPGNNVIRHCTGRLPFLANGGAIYGGTNNRIEDCEFTDITAGCGILISTSFPTADEKRGIDNNFNGTTSVSNCHLVRCGGYDHNWAWRGALQFCMEHRSISGVLIREVVIDDTLSDAISIVAPGTHKGQGTLSNSRLENVRVNRVGLGAPERHSLYIRADVRGDVTLIQSKIEDIQNSSVQFKVLR
jgi:parallel beta-helix repeat protein